MLSRNRILLLTLLLCVLPATAGVLHRAAAEGDIAALEAGIQEGENIDATDRRGMTPLHKAAANGQVKAVEILLAKGADPELKDRDGRNVLKLAKDEGQDAVVEFIKEWNSRKEEDDDAGDCG